ncbi:hypothetical protein STEG23_037830 [Scotinomys teguina]
MNVGQSRTLMVSISLSLQVKGQKRGVGPTSPGPKNLWGNAGTQFEASSLARRATPGFAGLDLHATTGLVLTQKMGVQAIETDLSGPLERGTVGLVLGRSSSTMRGLFVLPGVVDSDYTGMIKVLCHSPHGIISIAPGDSIAQLLVLPSLHEQFKAKDKERKDGGLGSSGVHLACLSMEMDQRPILDLLIEGKVFSGLLDTGADQSIIQSNAWPKHWPLQNSSQTLQGLGYAHTPSISAKELTWRMEDQQGTVQPFVVDIPINLWGRDIQQQLQLRLTNDYSEASKNMMKSQGYVPTKRHLARDIVKSCPSCVTFLYPPHVGVNPKGLKPNALWQMDVTHIPEFGKLKYLHVSVDTYSGVIHATPLVGEKGEEDPIWVPHRLMQILKDASMDDDVPAEPADVLDEPTAGEDRAKMGDPVGVSEAGASLA